MCRLQDKPEIDSTWGYGMGNPLAMPSVLGLGCFCGWWRRNPADRIKWREHTQIYVRVAKGQSKAARIRFALLCSALAHAQRVGLCCPRPWSLVLAPRFRQGGWQSSRNWDLYWVIIYCPSSSRLRSSQNREIIGNNFACWIDWFAFLGSKSKLQFSFVSVSSDEEYFCGSSLTV